MDAFLEANITAFIDLTSPGERVPYLPILEEEAGYYEREIRYYRFPIGDFGLPTREQMTAILDAIDDALAEGHNLYLHCWGGIGRTGTVVGCYLVRHGMSGEQALKRLGEWWLTVPKSAYHPHSPETRAQYRFVLNWHEDNPATT
ncbi:MAG: phosphatase [Anaerolineae bacterium]|nr:MAG: phosphatase [Anaerolineae bacterium]